MNTNRYHSWVIQTTSTELNKPITKSVTSDFPPNKPPTSKDSYDDDMRDLAKEISELSLAEWEQVREILYEEYGVNV